MKIVKEVLNDSIRTAKILFATMIPVTIIVKVMTEIGMIKIIAELLYPLMKIVGLPGEMSIVFGTALLSTIYGGISALITLGDINLSVANITVISIMMLTAHALPTETAIVKQTKSNPVTMTVLRLIGAFAIGALINSSYKVFEYRQEAYHMPLIGGKASQTIWQWGIAQVKGYMVIFLIIVALMVFMKVLKKTGILDWINKLCNPVFTLIGISKKAAPLVMIGLTMGMTYGAGLIINEIEKEAVTKEEIFYSMAFLSLCHSVVEDTILLFSLGADLIGILAVRIVFAFIVIYTIRVFCESYKRKSNKKGVVQ